MIINTTQKNLKDSANFEASTPEELAHRLLAIGVIKVTDIKHLASSMGVYGQYFAVVGDYEDKQGIMFTFYTDNVYNNFTAYSTLNELNIRLKLLTKHKKSPLRFGYKE